MKYRLLFILFFGLVTSLLLTSCSPWVVINQGSHDQWLILNSSGSIGQTFVAEYSGLQAVNFMLAPQSPGNGFLTLHLRSEPASIIDLVSVQFPISSITSMRFYRFEFPNIEESSNQYYYAFLTVDGEGSVDVRSGPADAYQNGSAYQNHEPIEAQLALKLDYDRSTVILGIFLELLIWILIVIVSFLLFIIPGWAFMSVLWKGWRDLSWFEKIALAIGVSLVIYIFLVLITFMLHIQFGRWYAWFPIIFGVLIIVWRNKPRKSKNEQVTDQEICEIKRLDTNKSFRWLNICLIIILLLIIISRFWAMRGLDQPMWNDSLHHTEITQLIHEHQGLFSSWIPYAQFKSFRMHFGFPLAAALLSWMVGLSSGQAVLYIGQIFSIFAPLSLYPIAVRLAKGNHLAGLIAVLTAGLLSPMPAFYINWGRYAQLAGQVILPVAMWMLWDVVNNTRNDNESKGWLKLPWSKIIISSIVIAGMVLCEFRMVFVISTFVISLCIGELIKYFSFRSKNWLRESWALVWIGLISIVIFLPWGLQLQQSNFIKYITFSNAQVNYLMDLVKRDYQEWQHILFYVPIGLIILGFLGWIWAIIKRDWPTASLGLWIAEMASLYSLILLHVPWVQYVQSFSVLIFLYIPIGLLVGYFTADLNNRLLRWKTAGAIVFTLIIIIGLLGVWNQRNISRPNTHALVTRPDTIAMQWISEETAVDSRFLVEGTTENWKTNVIGTDAGWWIPLLAHRENTIPPQYALANEIPIEPDYSQRLINLQSQLEKTSLVSEAGVRLLCEYGITHVYIGQKQGKIANAGEPLFTPTELAASSVFHLIYHQDRVYIYAVEGACDQ
jgi:hypothetical protein